MSVKPSSILVVDDDAGHREMLRGALSAEVDEVRTAASGEEALGEIELRAPDLVLLDMRMPGMSGIEVLEEMRRRGSRIPTLVLTAFADVEDAVHAMKLGASDYLRKPIDLTTLVELVRTELGITTASADTGAHPNLPDGFVFESPLMQGLLEELARVATSDVPVLLTGESGTGKEVLAELLHLWSNRRDASLVAVSVSALPETLVESELFGAQKGAYTGSDRDRMGLIERASGGTLFLDEVGEMPAAVQPKLLRVLETRTFSRIGEEAERSSDFRLISATNRDLEEEVRAERFRLDLYYRLAVVAIEVPPLRERTEDILPLARTMLDDSSSSPRHLSPATESALLSHPWPGNIRELRNAIQRAAILAAGDIILPEHLPPTMRVPARSEQASGGQLADVERRTILEALERCDGNRTHAARMLGISRRKLLYRLKEYGDGA